MVHFADRLAAALRTKGNCLSVGLDPRWKDLPTEICRRYHKGRLEDVAQAFQEFCVRVIDLVAPLVAVVKPQSAFFELAGPVGMSALQTVLRHARDRGLMTILDYKRNDIASTAEAYAEAGLGGMRVGNQLLSVWDADAVTVNPYLGRESVEPFLACARRSGRGVFILARTSNPGASQFQNLVCDGKPLFLHVAQAIGEWSRENLGNCGYGDVGAVVGATRPQELALIRAHVPEAIFLLPGFGVQGATAADTAAAFDKLGLGAVVNSARGITFCFEPADPEWEAKVVLATKKAIADLAEKTSMSRLAL